MGRPLATRRLDMSRCVSLGLVRSRCASTMAPSAAVMSRALVASKGNTYVVKISVAIPVRLPGPPLATDSVAGPRAACPRPRMSSTTRAIPATAAASRWPLIVSTSDSRELTPISIMTKRNSMRTAPVYTMTCTNARNGAPCMA